MLCTGAISDNGYLKHLEYAAGCVPLLCSGTESNNGHLCTQLGDFWIALLVF